MKKFTLFCFACLMCSMTFALPPGNYEKTCHACTFFNGTLNCFCNDEHGFPSNTSLNVHHNCHYIQNINGHLKCTHHRHYPRPFGNGFEIKSDRMIFNRRDADSFCPRVCGRARMSWSGDWNSYNNANISLCRCRF